MNTIQVSKQITNDMYILHIEPKEFENNHTLREKLNILQVTRTTNEHTYPDIGDLDSPEGNFLICNNEFIGPIDTKRLNDELLSIYGIENTQEIPTYNLNELIEAIKLQEETDIQLISNKRSNRKLYRLLPPWRRTEKVTLEALKRDPFNIAYVPLYSYTEKVITEAISKDIEKLYYIPREKLTPTICEFAFKKDASAIIYIPEQYQTPDMAEKALSQHGKYLQCLRKDLRTRDNCLKAFETSQRHWNIAKQCKYIPDSDILLEIIKRYGFEIGTYQMLCHAQPELINSSIVTEAIKFDIRCISLIPEHVKINNSPDLTEQERKDIMLVSKEHDEEYRKLPDSRKTEVVSFAAVCANTFNIIHVPGTSLSERIIAEVAKSEPSLLGNIPENRRTKEICMLALEHADHISEKVLPYIPEKYVTADIRLKAVKKCGYALQVIENKFKTKKMCRIAYQNTPIKYEEHLILRFIPFPDIVLEALKYYSRNHKIKPLLKFVDPAAVDDKLADWAIKKDSSAVEMLPNRFLTKERLLTAARKTGCNGFLTVYSSELTPEICLVGLKTLPSSYTEIPPRKRTPEIELFIYKWLPDNNPYKKELQLKYSETKNNIFVFNSELEKRLGKEIEYDTIIKIYQGNPVFFKELKTPAGILQNIHITYDGKEKQLEIKSADSVITQNKIRNNIEEYLIKNIPDYDPKTQTIKLRI